MKKKLPDRNNGGRVPSEWGVSPQARPCFKGCSGHTGVDSPRGSDQPAVGGRGSLMQPGLGAAATELALRPSLAESSPATGASSGQLHNLRGLHLE